MAKLIMRVDATKTSRRLMPLVLTILLSFIVSYDLCADQGQVAATIIASSGDVQIHRDGAAAWQDARATLTLYAGDSIRTGGLGSVSLLLADESIIKLHRLSELTLKQVAPQAGWMSLRGGLQTVGQKFKSLYELARGELWLRNKNRDVDIEVRTANVTTSIRGTEFAVAIGEAQTTITILEGVVQASNALGSLEGRPGEEIAAPPGGALRKRVLVNPQNAVQWTLAIPAFFRYGDLPLISSDRRALQNELDTMATQSGQDRLSSVRVAGLLRDLGQPAACLERLAPFADGTDPATESVIGWCLLDSGDTRAALAHFATFETVEAFRGRIAGYATGFRYDEAGRELVAAQARFPEVADFDVQAALLELLAGRHDAAETRLAAVVASHPANATAWRYRALNAVILGNTAVALEAETEAVRLAPDAPSAHIVAAYVQQMQFDLTAAERANRNALALDPDNITALVNLARLQFGDGRIAESAATLARASRLAPRDAELLVLVGYTALADRHPTPASAAFDAALLADPSNADAWLGRGILAMRNGETAAALEAVTAAVALEPQRSLYMSYWGKMLYQIHRFDKAIDVLLRAEQLDPRDPTPLFYRALILRDLNQPSEAIQLLNRAIALNDNRGVYRSRYLLDQDLAVRNIDLSVAYEELGLDAWSRAKAIDAIKADYRNYSGHLALAGTLQHRADRAAAFANEQLLARLLQPANVNTLNTFNEYTALFEQAASNGVASLRAGSFDHLGGEVLAYGNLPKHNLAWQAGVFRDATDGWRDTNQSYFTDGAAIVKWEPTAKDGLLFTINVLKALERDEQFQRYEASSVSDPLEHQGVDQTRAELGYHRKVSQATDVIAYFSYMNQVIDQRDHGALRILPLPGLAITVDNREDTEQQRNLYQGQLQIMHTLRRHQLIVGVLALGRPLHSEFEGVLRATAHQPGFGPDTSSERITRFVGHGQLDFHSGYVHDLWTVSETVSVDAAIYADHVANSSAALGTYGDTTQINPRLGLAWRFLPHDVLRLGAFRYVLPAVPARTDPNDVAGITIARNFLEGARVSEAALQWEHEWRRGFAAVSGFVLHSTSKDEHATQSGAIVMRALASDEHGAELEVNHLLTDNVAVTGGYRFAVVRDQDYPPQEIAVEPPLPDNDRVEQSLSAGLRFVIRRGLSGGLGYTFRYLDLRDGRANESINLLDLVLGQELPRKRGRVELRIDNLLDKRFDWVTDRFAVEGRAPAREVLGTMTINF